jgi:hypothetical protein
MKIPLLAFCMLSAACAMAGDSSIAVVLGKPVPASAKDELSSRIVSALVEGYVKDNNITVTSAEQEAFLKDVEARELEMDANNDKLAEELKKELAAGKLSVSERKEKEANLKSIESLRSMKKDLKENAKGMEAQMRPMMLEMAKSSVLAWKVNKALYAKYGGRIAFQQSGAEPVDAWRNFLKAEEAKGSFKITDKDCAASFWRYYTDDSMHTFLPKEDAVKFIDTPWWQNRIQPGSAPAK